MDSTCSVSAAPAGLTVQVCFPGARAAVLDNLNRQREEGRLCDLSIQVQGQVFRAHRCVLAASSPYFHDQVLLKNVTTVSLPSVMDPVAFESVLSSAYTGQLSIVHDDIVNYVTVASFLQMWHIVDKCTEILKRPRPVVEVPPGEAASVHQGATSRQQSPSSTDCLNMEREGKRRERKPDALPPLATWRRPQQFPRWGRPRPSSAQHLAETRLDALSGYTESEYGGCEEAWVSSHVKTSHFAHDGPAHNSRHHGGFAGGEAAKQKARFQQRGAPPSSERLRGSGDGDESQERRKNERREIEADEGIGENAVEKESSALMGTCVPHQVSNVNAETTQAGKLSADASKEKAQKEVVGSDHTSTLSAGLPCQSGGDGVEGPSCSDSGRSQQQQWPSGPWSHQEHRPQGGEAGTCGKGEDEEQEEEEVDFECLVEGTFSRDTYDEIEDGTGQVSQRPLVPTSPDFTMTGSEAHWTSAGVAQSGPLTSNPGRHGSPSSAAFPPPSSPPTPSSSSSVSLSGSSYSGKVHFCHCGKAYTLKSMRDRHVKMQHLNLRPFGCPVCTKSFKMKHHLTKHLKTHGGLRPYECGLCGKKVIWRDSFLRHQARCQRLASSSAGSGAGVAAADMDEGYGYAFEEGEAFLLAEGQVKVEQVDFHGGVEDRMGALLAPGMVDQLRSQSADAAHVFKKEASESFSGN